MNTPSAPEKHEQDPSFDIAKRAMPMMARHGVKPTPKNYAIWYTYVAGQNAELNHEIETILNEKMSFTDDIGEFLYNKFLAEKTDDKVVRETTNAARKMMMEVLASIQAFSGETEAQSKEVAKTIEALSGEGGSDEVKMMAQKIIESAAAMRGSGDALNAKLEESRKEVNALRENLAKATQESERDFLTGLYNRKAMDKKLEEMVANAKEQKSELCVLMVDVDHFKQFNDKFGHLIGDEVLKIVAKTLTDAVKGMDIVARYGGEEFAVMLPNTPLGGAMIVGEILRKSVASKELKRRDTGENYGAITVSIGVSRFRHDVDTIPTFLKRSDDALYRSKKSGRNRVTQESLKDE